MKKNGFTLTEMIAVIVIISVILLVTIPIMNRITNNNAKEKYMFYVETVEKALYTYGDIELPMSITGEHEVTLAELIDKKYLKSFNEDEVTVDSTTVFEIKKTNGKVVIFSPRPFKLIFKKGGSVIATCDSKAC